MSTSQRIRDANGIAECMVKLTNFMTELASLTSGVIDLSQGGGYAKKLVKDKHDLTATTLLRMQDDIQKALDKPKISDAQLEKLLAKIGQDTDWQHLSDEDFEFQARLSPRGISGCKEQVVKAKLDTGCEDNWISLELLGRARMTDYIEHFHPPKSFTGFGGPLEVSHKIEIDWYVPSQQKRHAEFYVAEQLPFDMIIGSKYIKTYQLLVQELQEKVENKRNAVLALRANFTSAQEPAADEQDRRKAAEAKKLMLKRANKKEREQKYGGLENNKYFPPSPPRSAPIPPTASNPSTFREITNSLPYHPRSLSQPSSSSNEGLYQDIEISSLSPPRVSASKGDRTPSVKDLSALFGPSTSSRTPSPASSGLMRPSQSSPRVSPLLTSSSSTLTLPSTVSTSPSLPSLQRPISSKQKQTSSGKPRPKIPAQHKSIQIPSTTSGNGSPSTQQPSPLDCIKNSTPFAGDDEQGEPERSDSAQGSTRPGLYERAKSAVSTVAPGTAQNGPKRSWAESSTKIKGKLHVPWSSESKPGPNDPRLL